LPVTFLAHQAPVLPLKLAAPRRWDGTALVVGSMVPDLAYATMGTPWYVPAHDPGPQLWFCLPLGTVATVVARRELAPVLAAHLPDRAPWHLRDYAALGRWPAPGPGPRWPPWLVLAVSVLTGSLSHVALDSFTHSHGWVVENVELLRAGLLDIAVYNWLQFGLSALGAAVSLVVLRAAGRRRIVRSTYGPPPLRATPASERRLRWGLGVAAVGGLAVMFLTLDRGGGSALMLRPVVVAAVTLCPACRYARRVMTHTPSDPLRP
jgi:hypothetical protein